MNLILGHFEAFSIKDISFITRTLEQCFINTFTNNITLGFCEILKYFVDFWFCFKCLCKVLIISERSVAKWILLFVRCCFEYWVLLFRREIRELRLVSYTLFVVFFEKGCHLSISGWTELVHFKIILVSWPEATQAFLAAAFLVTSGFGTFSGLLAAEWSFFVVEHWQMLNLHFSL